jgi:hypothetical protein
MLTRIMSQDSQESVYDIVSPLALVAGFFLI